MNSVKLSTLISRGQRYYSAYNVSEQDFVRDLDDAIRRLSGIISTPTRLKKSTLKVFADILEYPVANDHSDLAYLDNQTGKYYPQKARFSYTSLQQFYENPENRNYLAEIWQNGNKYLGVRYKSDTAISTTIDSGEDVSGCTASGDASSPSLDGVNRKDNNYTIKFNVVLNTGVATVKENLTYTPSTTDYQKNYFFLNVYLSAVPTSIDLILATDGSNYLSKNITSQFSGSPLVANDWNLIAIDLNNCTTTGTIGSQFAYYQISLNGAAAGVYNLGEASLKQWTLMDYWYYSKYNCQANGSSVPDQEFFYNSSDVYSTDTSLVGDDEWVDICLYDACITSATDGAREGKQNNAIIELLTAKRRERLKAFGDKYPDMTPIIITSRYNFRNDFNVPYSGGTNANNW